MKVKEIRRLALAQIALQQFRLGLSEIHQDQSIERVRELRVDVEAEEFAPEFQVLTKQYWEPDARRLKVGYDGGEVFDVEAGRRYVFACMAMPATERISRGD